MGEVAVDIETGTKDKARQPDGGLNPRDGFIRTVQLAVAGHSFLIDCYKVKDLTPVAGLLLDETVCKIGHGLQFENAFFLSGYDAYTENCFDTLIASRLLQPFAAPDRDGKLPRGWHPSMRTHTLKAVADRELGEQLSKDEQKSDWNRAELTENQIEYAFRDAEILLPLKERLGAAIDDLGMQRVARAAFAAVPAYAEIEITGMAVDLDVLDDLDRELRARAWAIEQKLALVFPKPQRSLFGDDCENLNARDRMRHAFNARYGLALESTTSAEMYRVAATARKKELREVATLFAEHSGLHALLKEVKQVREGVQADGRVYPHQQQGVQSGHGRGASSKPNNRKFPRADTFGPKARFDVFKYERSFRELFHGGDGRVLTIADFSGNQARIIAELAGEKGLIEAFNRGYCPHRYTASRIFGVPVEEVDDEQKMVGKTRNFMFFFGGSPGRAQQQMLESTRKIVPLPELERAHREFFSVLPALPPWYGRCRAHAISGKITIPSGRVIRFARGGEYHNQAVNFPVSGLEVDGMLLAMARVWRAWRKAGLRVKLCAEVYDELVGVAHPDDAEAAQAVQLDRMGDSMQRLLSKVPAKVEGKIGLNWSAK